MNKIFEKLKSEPSFSILSRAIERANLEELLTDKGPMTIFAPTDEAFLHLSPAEFDRLRHNKEKLQELLKYLIVPGTASGSDIVKIENLRTCEGEDIRVKRDGIITKVDNANVITSDIIVEGGIINIIDQVIFPLDMKFMAQHPTSLIQPEEEISKNK